MTDPTSIVSAINSLKAALDLAKGLRSVDVTLEKAELKLRIAELIDALVSARVSMGEAQEEIAQLRKRVATLEDQKSEQAKVFFRNDAYWRKVDDAPDDGPFCSKCHDVDSKMVRMQDRGNGFICCPSCHHCIDSPNKPPPQRGREYEPLDFC